MALSAIQLQRLDASRKPVIAQSEEEEQGGLSQAQLIKLGRGDIPDPTTSPYLEAVDKASHNDPDKMIEAIALEQETNLPTEIIEEDPEEAKRQAWVKANGWDMEGDEDSPKTTEWLSDPDKATVAKDDYSNLREIEKTVRQQEAYDGMEFQDLGNILESWLIGIPKMGHQLAYWMGQDEMKLDTSTLDKQLRDDALAAGDQEMLGRLDKIDVERAELDAIAAENMADLKAEIEFRIARTNARMAMADPTKIDGAQKLLSDFLAGTPDSFHYCGAGVVFAGNHFQPVVLTQGFVGDAGPNFRVLRLKMAHVFVLRGKLRWHLAAG